MSASSDPGSSDPGSLADRVRSELRERSDPSSVPDKERFFQARPGGYAEGDRFLGVSVPEQRRVARAAAGEARLEDVADLLGDPFHEVRLTALFMLVRLFQRSRDEATKRRMVELYCRRIDFVNNWDLVDSSAPQLLGAHLLEHAAERPLLLEWARSGHLWRQRAAVLATLTFIRAGRFDETLELARELLDHDHDLIHKAVGWMLREIGARAPEVEHAFLDEHAGHMPRTMLRYAVEKLPEELRRRYLGR